jgi:hypothetical protein
MKALRISLVVVVMLMLMSLLPARQISRAGITGSQFISLYDADYTLGGEQDGDWAGYGVAPAGDVNGDGLQDILIGAAKAGTRIGDFPAGEGKAYLVLGKPKDQWQENPLNLAHADASFSGCWQGSMSGRQNYAAGDINGDGYDDFLLSGWQCSLNGVTSKGNTRRTGQAIT